jgi:NAD(P)-dependent dehydrogenase (short-subunit alcohol dehydrogenase family)
LSFLKLKSCNYFLAIIRELAVIYAQKKIRVNALFPGPLKMELLMKYLNIEEKKQRKLVHVPMERFSLAEEITKRVLFFAFEEIKVKVKF